MELLRKVLHDDYAKTLRPECLLKKGEVNVV